MEETRLSHILMIAFNVLLLGVVWVVVGRLLVTLLRRFLLDGRPPVEQNGNE